MFVECILNRECWIILLGKPCMHADHIDQLSVTVHAVQVRNRIGESDSTYQK
jgi:hypothetical protein